MSWEITDGDDERPTSETTGSFRRATDTGGSSATGSFRATSLGSSPREATGAFRAVSLGPSSAVRAVVGPRANRDQRIDEPEWATEGISLSSVAALWDAPTVTLPKLTDPATEVLSFESRRELRTAAERMARGTRGTISGLPAQRPSSGPGSELVAGATSFPPGLVIRPTSEHGLKAWVHDTRVLTGRQLLVWSRDAGTLLQSLLFPIVSMMMFKVVLGDVVGEATGQNSAFGTVPLVVLVSAMFGSLAAGVTLAEERRTGLLQRLYALPIHRTADLSSRILCELVRILSATAIILAAGHLIGFRFTQGMLPALAIFGVALLYGAAYSAMVLTLGLSELGKIVVPLVSLISSLLMFFNSGFSPIESYPEWLQPVVRNQPMTCAVEVIRSLAAGGPLADNLVKCLAWSLSLLVLFAYPAVRSYRKAAANPR